MILPGSNLVQWDGKPFVTPNNFWALDVNHCWQRWFSGFKKWKETFQGKEMLHHSLNTSGSLQKSLLGPFGTELPSGTERAFLKSRSGPWLLTAEKTAAVPPKSHSTLTIEEIQTFPQRDLNKCKCWDDVMLFVCVHQPCYSEEWITVGFLWKLAETWRAF